MCDHYEALAHEYKVLNADRKSYISAEVIGGNLLPGAKVVKVAFKKRDLTVLKDVHATNQYLLSSSTVRLNSVPEDCAADTIESYAPLSGNKCVRVRTGDRDDGDVLEAWNERGLEKCLKLKGITSRIYNDAVFGGIKWNTNETKVIFIGEIPKPKDFKSHFEKIDAADGKKALMSEKFEYQSDFGETLENKISPAIFVYDLVENLVHRVDGIPDNLFPQNPCFDETGVGIVFQAVDMPVKKLGLNFCLNRPTGLYHIPNWCSTLKPEIISLTSDLYLAFNPVFSPDFSKLAFFGRRSVFNGHSSCFELFYLSWPMSDRRCRSAIPLVEEYPIGDAEFAGIYGYHATLAKTNFVSSFEIVFESMVNARSCIFLLNLKTCLIRPLSQSNDPFFKGEYHILHVSGGIIVYTFQTFRDVTPAVWTLEITETSTAYRILEYSVSFSSIIQQEELILENGAQAYLCYANIMGPMLVLLHGGPFGCSSRDALPLEHLLFLAQGYTLLVVNYRGSSSLGMTFMDSLLGQIGNFDVHDCGELTLMAVAKFGGKVFDAERIGVYGGSHGGFLTGWMIGHPKYKRLFQVACLWNPVLNMSFMIGVTDIPDWVTGCVKNESEGFLNYDESINSAIFKASQFSVVDNVEVPVLLLLGGKDLRVPPNQGIQYYNALKKRGLHTKLFYYPDGGHAIAPVECNADANLNIHAWFRKYLFRV